MGGSLGGNYAPLISSAREETKGRGAEKEDCSSRASRKCRGCIFMTVMLLLGLLFVGILLAVGYFMWHQKDLDTTTRILVCADTFWKASFFAFIAVGLVTVLCARIESDPKNDWVMSFWTMEAISCCVCSISVDVKSWQATGFILRPLGLYVLGTFLFVTQIILEEQIHTGKDWLEVSKKNSEKRCFFMEQVDWQTARNRSTLFEHGSDFSHVNNLSVWTTCKLGNRSCKLREAGVDFFTVHNSDLPSYVHALWGYYIRRTPPSMCYGAENIFPLPAFNIPKKDFALGEVDLQKEEFKNFTFAAAYVGGDLFDFDWWNPRHWWHPDHAMYFTDSVRTACHYECTEWAQDTAVNKLLNLGMVIGGGMAIVMLSNSVGGYLGNKLVTPDTSVEDLEQAILCDVRVLYLALPQLFCCPKAEHCKYWGSAWKAVGLLILKIVMGALLVCVFYRKLVVSYSESLADRGLVRCIVYVSLFVTSLRSLFCFTKQMWNTGEDQSFYKKQPKKSEEDVTEEPGGEAGMEVIHISYDLYGWMRLSGEEVIDTLFDYTFTLGEDELSSNKEIEVKMLFPTVEDHLHVEKGAQGWIHKAANFGAIYEGTKVFVRFHSGVKEKRGSQKAQAQKADGQSSQGLEMNRRTSERKTWKIPVDPSFLVEVSKTERPQEELKIFLGLTPKANGDA